jgi:site-specific recombinase XerD
VRVEGLPAAQADHAVGPGDFRRTWDDSPLYALKNIERLRSFFRFCQRMKWVSENPALALKIPRATAKPTLPFTAAEMSRILAASDTYRGPSQGFARSARRFAT